MLNNRPKTDGGLHIQKRYRNWWAPLRLYLVIFIALWFFVIRYFLHSSTPASNVQPFNIKRTTSIHAELNADSNIPYNHVIVVPGHSVIDIDYLSNNRFDKENSWKLLDYQEHQKLPNIIETHIEEAINLTKNDKRSILIYSGGQTRVGAGPISEGLSYYIYSKQKNLIDPNLDSRIYLEEFARDSFENLLFSISRFREVTGCYPTKVTVVGFDFKMARFRDLHRVAIGFPESSFHYVALDPRKVNSQFDYVKASAGEKDAYSAFERDMYGCNMEPPPFKASFRGPDNLRVTNPQSAELFAKRLNRNPFQRTAPYQISCPEISELLKWCSFTVFTDIYPNYLPW